MIFGHWDETIHEDPEQIKRIVNGIKIKDKNVVELNKSECSSKIQGSGVELYNTTLDSCTCMDFNTRKLPCKHIYKLADMLHLIPPLPEKSKKAEDAFLASLPNEIEKYKKLYKNGAISADKFCKIVTALTSK